MSMWGEALTVEGVTMVPMVEGPMGTEAASTQLVSAVSVTNIDSEEDEPTGLDMAAAFGVVMKARVVHIGRPYADWLARLPSLPSAQ